MDRRVLHHLHFAFPLDRHFYGQGFVVADLLANSSLPSSVISSGVDSSDDPLQAALVQDYFRTELFKVNYIGHADALAKLARREEEIKEREVELRALKEVHASLANLPKKQEPVVGRIQRKERLIVELRAQGGIEDVVRSLGPNNYFDMIAELTRSGDKLILAYHNFFGRPLKPLSLLNGEAQRTVFHLHCLADLYFSHADPLAPQSSKDLLEFRKIAQDPSQTFIAVSDAVRTSFERYSSFATGNLHVVRNGVSEDLYRIVSPEEKEDFRHGLGVKGKYLIGYSGRMERTKGVESLKELLKQAEADPSLDYGFVFASSNGTDRKEFLLWIEENTPRLVSQDRVKVCIDVAKLLNGGHTYDNQVIAYFHRQLEEEGVLGKRACGGILLKPMQPHLDVYVHPALSEAISLAVVEAVMSGVPVVASNVGGIPEVVNFNNGYLIEVRGRSPLEISADVAQGISTVIDRYHGSDTLDYRMRGRENLVLAGYTAKDMARKVDEIYQSL